MAFITALTRDRAVFAAAQTAVGDRSSVAGARTWDRLTWLVRERPVTGVVLDSAVLPRGPELTEALTTLLSRFPSLGTVLVARRLDPVTLLRLGRASISGLVLTELDDVAHDMPRLFARASDRSTVAAVARRLGSRLGSAERGVVRAALDGALIGWTADELAAHCGWTRAHLSVRLTAKGLPSAGHLLLWSKMLHAGRWLPEPGRSAESVSRQLEYSSGAAFRRALKNYLSATPTEVIEAGGFEYVLARFLDVCGLADSVVDDRSVA